MIIIHIIQFSVVTRSFLNYSLISQDNEMNVLKGHFILATSRNRKALFSKEKV